MLAAGPIYYKLHVWMAIVSAIPSLSIGICTHPTYTNKWFPSPYDQVLKLLKYFLRLILDEISNL